ncbi:Undecaprenyl-diphosphatase [Anatilimnocola aggregata]|uniref:Undecaprenyl-diphosphatase n=1 Tax=Anatilimnocola aggregata TaxID=2528021 RepID=A0A517Y6B5_9BACT|nr:undecaprenyl-diphosphate phosphatase [Anatilimnocola aggregata]QDU25778.1 Undecaprenyl-diphosphatase [Anatilimnocola aggregata]
MSFSLLMLLAVVQGVAEFLPISSSGHLVVLGRWLGGSNGEFPDLNDVNIVLHLGTLGSIIVFYHRQILQLLTSDRRVIGLMFLGTLPAVFVGLPLKLLFDDVLNSPLVAGCLFPLTGFALLWSSRLQPAEGDYRAMTWQDALFIGCCQAVAILPGLSRSGTTIAAGLSRNLNRSSAATFSFLLAIPAILGAGVLEGLSMWKDGKLPETPLGYLLIGALVSFFVGLFSVWLLNRWLQRGRIHLFAWYCIALGIVVVSWQLAIKS